jgi:tRNA dimethylallyltransferase
MREGNEGHVDGLSGDQRAGGFDGLGMFRLDYVSRNALMQPVDFAADFGLDALQQRQVERRVGGIGDKAKDRQGVLVAQKRAVLIAGPTASGKSALALGRAQELGGTIVNTDALQVYSGLRLITARPGEADIAVAPHLLYGEVDPAVRFSTGDWARAAERVIADTDGPLIFAGGTGLYLESLIKGFADVPEIPSSALAWAEAEVHGLDREARTKLIAARDPAMLHRLKGKDPQRVIRALAVLRATGRSLATFQDEKAKPLLKGWKLERIVLNPARDVLRERIAKRFTAMLEQGAVEEVEAFLARRLDPSLPAMKAIGVREIGDWLAGRSTREEMIEQAVTATRQYAKRQRTWFRGRMADWEWVES